MKLRQNHFYLYITHTECPTLEAPHNKNKIRMYDKRSIGYTAFLPAGSHKNLKMNSQTDKGSFLDNVNVISRRCLIQQH